MSGRGLDLTDEGMYLNWMTTPWEWPWASTQFAFLFHPLWVAAGMDLVLARRLTVVLLLLVATGFFAVLLRYAFGLRWGPGAAFGLLLSPTALLAVGSQSTYFTPSYNMLGLLGALLSGAALIGILVPRDAEQARGMFWPWVWLGIGGVVCFASRPTAGALLLVIVLLAVFVAGAWSWKGLGIAAATALVGVLAMALAIDGNPLTFVARVLEGLNLYSIQTDRSAREALLNTFTYEDAWQPDDVAFGVLASAVLMCAVLVVRFVPKGRPALAAALAAVPALAAGWIAATGYTVLSGTVQRSVTVAFLLWLGASLPGLIGPWRSRRGALAAAGALWLLPLAFAFGTHYSTLALMGSVAFCWLASSMVLLGSNPATLPAWPVVAGAWLLTTALCLNAAAGAPPRQEPLEEQTVGFALAGRGEVGLSEDMASYLDGVASDLAAAGFEPGMPVLDLTGESPGLIHHLQALPTADSWVIGRYPGSQERLSRELILHTECEISGRSWLLVSPDGARRIDPDVLSVVGFDFPADYRQVAERKAPERSGALTVEVWEPVDGGELTARCLERG